MNELTILCKVVDNFGDAGVVLRLARAMCALEPSLCLRIITDNRKLFDMLQGDSSCSSRIRFFDWDDSEGSGVREFSENPPGMILECFACGRPDWLEHLLFDDVAVNGSHYANENHSASAGLITGEGAFTIGRVSASDRASASTLISADGCTSATARITHIVNVEFLTAEDYADEFHLMKSGTRSLHVKKSIFMPGFTRKTGGLILDGIFAEAEKSKVLPKNILHLQNNDRSSGSFNILVFTYDRKIVPLVSALSYFKNFLSEKVNQNKENDVWKNLNVHVARGVGFVPFIDSWENANKPFTVNELPFLPQEKWDEFLATCDFLFVRGEDSVSRACLSGVPFVWQAYVQEDDYHLVKVNALLERMNPHYSEEDFKLVSTVWRAFNVSADTSASKQTTESDLIFEMLKKSSDKKGSLVKGFESFAKSLYENGDAAKHLLEYVQILC